MTGWCEPGRMQLGMVFFFFFFFCFFFVFSFVCFLWRFTWFCFSDDFLNRMGLTKIYLLGNMF